MSGYKKVIINNSSFVGVSSRSKSGCIGCKKRKKKCDEVHPVCGPCLKKGSECIWKDESQNKNKKFDFDIKPIMESQKLIQLERSSVKKPVSQARKESKNELKLKAKVMKNNNSIESTSSVSSNNSIPSTTDHLRDLIISTDPIDGTRNLDIPKNSEIPISLKEDDIFTPTTSQLLAIDSTIPWFNSPKVESDDVEGAVDEILHDNEMLNSLITNVMEHVKSPTFNPSTNFVDLSINSALQHAHSYLNHAKMKGNDEVSGLDPHNDTDTCYSDHRKYIYSDVGHSDYFARSPFNTERFMNIESDDNHSEIVTSSLPNKGDVSAEDEAEGAAVDSDVDEEGDEYDSNDKYLPMDESQMLENLYISDSDLICVFKSKKLHPYLRPAVHLLLSKNNALKMIKPSSPILNQLDSTGKLFLENYITNLAMNQIDIGNNKFFLEYALKKASDEPVILNCLVAWGGMFLVGRNNKLATKYFDQSLRLIDQKKQKVEKKEKTNGEFDNDEHINLLLSYLLLISADVSTGDISRWFQMLLQCKDLLSKYGNFRQFVSKNKDNKLAKWIISKIFNHDVLCTRALDFGTIIPINEYNDVFKNQKFLQLGGDYGLDPFYGLSQNLYLLLGEVSNNRKLMKNLKYPLNYVPIDELSKQKHLEHYFKTEESWFQIFDSQIVSCKPPSDMMELLISDDPDNKLLEHHLTWYELTQITLRIYIRISFKELEFDCDEIQKLRSNGLKIFKVLIGTKLQSLLGLSLLMLGVTSTDNEQRLSLMNNYNSFLKNYQILNVQICWELINQVWKRYDENVANNAKHYVDWTEVVESMGWKCCLT